jgi:hypothetical protein
MVAEPALRVTSAPRRGVSFNVPDVRAAGGVMLGAALVLPALPGHPGFACPLRTLTGIPCPLCGMTTSVEAAAHGHLGAAFAATPAGVVAVLIALWLLVRPPSDLRLPVPIGIFILVAMWTFQLFRFHLLSV